MRVIVMCYHRGGGGGGRVVVFISECTRNRLCLDSLGSWRIPNWMWGGEGTLETRKETARRGKEGGKRAKLGR